MSWQKYKVELNNGKKFNIYIRKEFEEYAEPALVNWLPRTTEYTAESFVDYINSKGWEMEQALTELEYHERNFGK
jgi:hypothetical protein